MRRLLHAALLLLPLLPATPAAGGDERPHGASPFPQDFGPDLQADCRNPEGIAVDTHGFVYASAFSFTATANICVLDPRGRVVHRIPVTAGPGGVAALLGMLFVPDEGLFVTDLANGAAPNGRLLRVDRRGDVHVVATGFAAPNAIAIDRRGNLYVSDSFAGTVTRLRADGSGVATWASDPLLTTAGQPPFGANGMAFDAGERFLYVANTGDSNVLRIALRADGSAGPVEVWAHGADLDQRTGGTQSLHGADGIQFDVEGNLWVCANQANEIQVLSPAGELVARYRGAGGAALDFPASLIFRGSTLYLTNLSLATGAVNSKLSVMRAPVAGAPLMR